MSTSPDPVPPPSAPPLGEPTLAALCDTVREALAKATPGPWKEKREYCSCQDSSDSMCEHGDSTYAFRIGGKDVFEVSEFSEADAALIVLLVNNATQLVEGVRELEASHAEVLGELQDAEAEVTALQAKLADAERWRDVHELLAGARLQYSVGGIDGAHSVLKQMFDAYDTALSAPPGTTREATEEGSDG